MKKKVLKKIALLAAPVIWRKLRGKRGHHRWYHNTHRHWHRGPNRHGHKRRGIWL